MAAGSLTVALVHEVFFQEDGAGRFLATLREARRQGADLALLPELPLNPWSPAHRDPREEDAEPPDGPRARLQARVARAAGIGLVGGVIVRDARTGRRHNEALVFAADGRLVASYRKLHLPDEDGFWEADHYEPGDDPPDVVDAFGMPLGIQVCSDSHRPDGSYLLAARGAQAILVPRATEPVTFDRWRMVLAANARITGCYVLSVNRPEPDLRIPLGGPSIAVAPDGRVLLETTEQLALVMLEASVARAARASYPGYLPFRGDVYARGWSKEGMS